MINNTLIEKISSFKDITGKKPTAIYLGRDEIIELKGWVGSICGQTFEISHDPEFYGIRIYEVVAQTHIGIG